MSIIACIHIKKAIKHQKRNLEIEHDYIFNPSTTRNNSKSRPSICYHISTHSADKSFKMLKEQGSLFLVLSLNRAFV